MSIIDTLITDRTPADAALVRSLNATGWAAMTDEQRALYLSDSLKGAYKASDLNRVNAAMDYLVGRLKSRGINVELKRSEINRDKVIETAKTVTLTGSNVSQLFSVTNGSYYFAPSGGTWTTNNGGYKNTTASTIFTALRDMSVSFGYFYSSEQNYDKFTLIVAGTTVEDAVSGSTTTKAYSAELKAGDTIQLTYAKDSSTDSNDDKCSLFNFVASYMDIVVIPTDKDPHTWYDSTIPDSALLKKYLANVSAMRAVLLGSFPNVPSDMDDGLTIEEANNIEVVLVTIEQLIKNMLAADRHCGATVGGMGGIII